jgi:hypothetical protein
MLSRDVQPEGAIQVTEARRWRLCWRVFVAALVILAAQSVWMPSPARAVPSFARQTGMPCTACHTSFITLTPFGRSFKLNGYVMRGGERTGNWRDWFKDIHLAAMAEPSFTHTNGEQPGGAGTHFGDNDNIAVSQVSFFYAGQLFSKVGTFTQGTYDGISGQWAWDNVDLRFADATVLGGKSLVYGVTLNNNPTVQDLWNSTPAWGYPYASSGLAPTPAGATLIQGAFAQQVFGFGGYGLWDDLVYGEVSAYTTLGHNVQQGLGVDPHGEAEIDTLAPYWRLALEHAWGPHYLEVGHYGMWAATNPARVTSNGTDKTLDIAFDAQYQYFGDGHDVTVVSTFITEHDDWNASQALGFTDRSSTVLNSFNLTAMYLYDKTYGLDVGVFDINGRPDKALYPDSGTGSPDSIGEIIEIEYLPFNKNGGPDFWPYSNVKLTGQYVIYQQFDGSRMNVDGGGRKASDNNTFYLQAWIAF